MKSKVLKKVLMLALTVSLATAPVMTAGAVSGNSVGSGTGSGTGGGSSSESSGGGKGGSSSSGAVVAAAPSVSEVKLADGTVMKTSVTGSYSAKSIAGVAVVTPASSVSAALGLTGKEQAYVTVADSHYGPQAQQCVKDAAAALGTEVGPVIDIFAGKLADGKFTSVAKANRLIEFRIGVPKDYVVKPGYELAVIRVEAGGAVTVLPNWSGSNTQLRLFTDAFGVFALTQVPAGTLSGMMTAQYNQANGL